MRTARVPTIVATIMIITSLPVMSAGIFTVLVKSGLAQEYVNGSRDHSSHSRPAPQSSRLVPSHPDLGALISGTNRNTQRHFFRPPNQIGLVSPLLSPLQSVAIASNVLNETYYSSCIAYLMRYFKNKSRTSRFKNFPSKGKTALACLRASQKASNQNEKK